MRQKEKNKYIIFSLIGILCLMTVGFAAFNQRLSVSESATNTNNWNISITNVITKTTGGSAVNNTNPTYSDLTATFDVGFTKKGDYIEYTVEVTNKGNVNASLDKINLTGSNDVVTMTYNGISEGDTLTAGEKKTFTVKLLYNEGLGSGTFNLTLDYIQGESSDGVAGGSGGNSNVVYRFTHDVLFIGDSIEGIETTTDSSTLGRITYLKHEIDSNNLITASYVCFITDKEYCMQGGAESYYENNKAILQANETWFNNDEGYCEFYDDLVYPHSECIGSAFSSVKADSGGYVVVIAGDGDCRVSTIGKSYCY